MRMRARLSEDAGTRFRWKGGRAHASYNNQGTDDLRMQEIVIDCEASLSH